MVTESSLIKRMRQSIVNLLEFADHKDKCKFMDNAICNCGFSGVEDTADELVKAKHVE